MCEGKSCPAMNNAVRNFSLRIGTLSTHHRTLLAGLLAEHITKAFLEPKVLHADVSKEMQAKYLEARTHGYADVLQLYCDLGGARIWPDKPSTVRFEGLLDGAA